MKSNIQFVAVESSISPRRTRLSLNSSPYFRRDISRLALLEASSASEALERTASESLSSSTRCVSSPLASLSPLPSAAEQEMSLSLVRVRTEPSDPSLVQSSSQRPFAERFLTLGLL